MKKISLFVLAICTSVLASAQLEIRPFAGINFSNVSETPDGTEAKGQAGYQFGVNLLIGNRVFLQPGISYFSRSTEFVTTDDVAYDQDIQGVYIPLLLGFRFLDPTLDPVVNGRIFAGPSLLFLTNSSYSDATFGDQVDWNDTNWGASFGLGLDISVFFIDLGYEFGITNTADIKDGPITTWDGFKQNTFFLNAGVRLVLKN